LDDAARCHVDVEVRLKARWLFERMLLESRSTEMSFVLIPPGKFQMGSPTTEPGRAADENIHDVTLTKAFLLGANEVTQHEYETVMATNPSWFSQSSVGKSRLGNEPSDDLPVERVSWFDALAFCNRLSDLDGLPPFYSLTQIALTDGSIRSAQVTVLGGPGYRLPTEAEWEYACRAGTQTPFHFGVSNTGREANVKPTLVSGGYGAASPKFAEISRTVRVGSYPSNEWQVNDMHGNAAEWCWDRYDKDYYPELPQTDPQGAEQGPHRVVRGGSWMVHEMQCRSASRFYMTPDERKDYVGFRVARTPKLPKPKNSAGD
ncbi:MAG: Serine/threonine-protein kinase pkn1, partial [Planctomycetota bacterium]